ncbi:MAG: TonB-dependent receptor [Candidatus Sulfotelmatobacter sp.]
MAPGWIQTVLDHALQSAKTGRRWRENLRFSGTYTIGDDVTWARGRHTFKFGVETRDAYSNSTNDFLSRPTVDFNNFANFGAVTAFVTGNPQVASNPTLQDMVWSLFGTVGSVTQAQVFGKGGNRTASDLRGFRQQDFDAFAQDTFKILPNLTLNYGLRYQFNGVPYEVNILLSTLFADPAGQHRLPSRSLGRKNKVCHLSTAMTGTTSSRASESHGILSSTARPRFARAMEFSTTGFSASCWDSHAETHPSSRFSFSRSLVSLHVFPRMSKVS